MSTVNILTIDDDLSSQSALQQVLGSEEWLLHAAPNAGTALHLLADGDWTLVIVSVGTTGMSGPLYATLRELALAPAMESGKGRVRVLFLVPEEGARGVQQVLESERLPYALKPLNLHDILDKVSDLLLEAGAIPQSIRQVRREGISFAGGRAGGRKAAVSPGARNTGMFANRDDYTVTEEEIAEYERQQLEEAEKRKKKRN